MASLYQQTLAFLHSPAVTLRTEEERLDSWGEEYPHTPGLYRIVARSKRPPPFEPRTPADTAAILDKLARRPADYYQSDTDPHAEDSFRADLLVKAMIRPDYWTPAAAAKRLAAFTPSPGMERVK
jgi:hypothetical protein